MKELSDKINKLLEEVGFKSSGVFSVDASKRDNRLNAYFGALGSTEDDLVNALLKLANENKSFPLSHPLYIFFFYSHPPLVERLKELGYRGAGIGQMGEDDSLKEELEVN